MEGVVEIFSKELLEMDRKTVKLIIDEMQEEIQRKEQAIQEKDRALKQQEKELTLAKRQNESFEQRIAELEKKLLEK